MRDIGCRTLSRVMAVYVLHVEISPAFSLAVAAAVNCLYNSTIGWRDLDIYIK